MTLSKELDSPFAKKILKNEDNEVFIQGMRYLVDFVTFEGLEHLLFAYHYVNSRELSFSSEERTLSSSTTDHSCKENWRQPSNLEIKCLLVSERDEQDHIDHWKNRKQLIKVSQKIDHFFQTANLFAASSKLASSLLSRVSLNTQKTDRILHWLPKSSQPKGPLLFLRSIYQLENLEKKQKRDRRKKEKRIKKKKELFLFFQEPIPQISFSLPTLLVRTDKKDLNKKIKCLKKLKKISREGRKKEKKE